MRLRMILLARFTFLMVLMSFVLETEAKTDKYRCMWRNDPATTITIGWNQVSGDAPTLYYDIYNHGTNSSSYSWSHTPDRKVHAKGMHNHFARLTGLQPNTVYHFIIVDSDGVSEPLSFKTAPDHSYERLSIIAGGDSRNHRTGRKNANKLVGKLRPHCVMFGGDMTGGDSAKEWKNWFDDWQYTVGEDGRLTPLIVARGNHEYSNQSIIDMFDVENPKVFYALNLGGDLLRVYTLNSLIASGGDQAAWLLNDLQENQHQTWKFAQYHFAIRPHTRNKREQKGQYKNWAIPFHQYGVNMVVESDAHVVKTTWPIRPTKEAGHQQGFIRDDQNGTVYIGEGCWGAPLRRNNDDKKWTRNSGSFNQFKWIFVGQDGIEVRTVETNNADQVGSVDPYDVFTPPANLKIWNPSNGPVLHIRKRNEPIYASADASSIISNPTPPVYQSNSGTAVTTTPEVSTYSPPAKSTPVASSTPPTPPPFRPATVLNYNATIENTAIVVKWEVKDESNDPYRFEIQKSTDGQETNYKTIARLKGIGNTGKSINDYKILDQIDNPNILSQVRYRICAIDPRGKKTFYNIDKSALLAQQWEQYPTIEPDPNSGVLKVRYELDQQSNVIIKLTGFNDKAVSKSQYQNQDSGNYLKSIDMKNIPQGVYLLTIKIDNDVVQQYQVLKNQG